MSALFLVFLTPLSGPVLIRLTPPLSGGHICEVSRMIMSRVENVIYVIIFVEMVIEKEPYFKGLGIILVLEKMGYFIIRQLHWTKNGH